MPRASTEVAAGRAVSLGSCQQQVHWKETKWGSRQKRAQKVEAVSDRRKQKRINAEKHTSAFALCQ